jgi:hypothetical protein
MSLADTSNPRTFIESRDEGWESIKSAPRDGTVIDVWLEINASPRSMGISDSFGVPDAWFKGGKWVHTYRGKPTELDESYITHWRSVLSR